MIECRKEEILVPLGTLYASMQVRVWAPAESIGTVFCVHGFEGNGSDFEPLAQRLGQNGLTVVAPDMLGRGQSAYLTDPSLYEIKTYLKCLGMLGHLRGAKNYFLGTSWGGVIALAFVNGLRGRADGLVLNDVALVSNQDVQALRVALRADAQRAFANLEEASAYVRESREYLGELSEETWTHYLANKFRSDGESLRIAYDPATTEQFDHRPDYDVTGMLLAMKVKTLMLFGRRSPFAADPRLERIVAGRPDITVVRDLNAGHPPSLMTPDQTLLVLGFLLSK